LSLGPVAAALGSATARGSDIGALTVIAPT
jgi:hypothetical protein